MVQKLFLSDQTYSILCEYDILKVWFNKIDHNVSIKGVKADIVFCRWFLLGEWVGMDLYTSGALMVVLWSLSIINIMLLCMISQ